MSLSSPGRAIDRVFAGPPGDEADWLIIASAALRYVIRAGGFGIELAREVAQGAVCHIVERVVSVSAPPVLHPRAWVYTVVHNKVRDQIRISSRATRSALEEAIEYPASGPDPSLTWFAHEILSTISRPLDRELVWLHFAEGWTWPELAERFNSAPGTLQQRAFRAVTSLRDRFGG